MKTIAFFNVKGGVGKTTSAINVAYNLAAVYKKRVLLVDLDPQANSSDFFDHDQLYMPEKTIEGVFTGEVSIQDAIYKTQYDGLDILPSTITLSRVEKQMISNTTEPQQIRLSGYLDDVKDLYDFCVLDCSPAAESLTNINGLAAADLVLIPLKSDKWALAGLKYTLDIINTVRRYNHRLDLGGAFFVQYENRNVNRESLNYITEQLGEDKALHPISKSKNAEETTYGGLPILVYDKKSRIAKDYLTLTEQINNLTI